ncbi:uncharacterized protein [Spinacia oleracea]|uniref:Retrotransposon gag domain-containing protein n=1 Tax=Spinacia oleracea TaxID=3562 RepID=A0A9R0JGA3_SPIOL|nr:uncharacterized protein LOC110806208 [Spinacia oleracea]
MRAPKEPKIKPPSIDAYHGTTDRDMHLLAYWHHMYVQGTNESTWCKYFPGTLKGVASKWLERLPAGTISSFFELEMLFSTRFMAYKEEKKTSMHLSRIQQWKYESLRSYVKQFNLESGQIPDLPDGVAFDNFIRGLKKDEVLDEDKAFIHATEICSVPKDPRGSDNAEPEEKKDKFEKKGSRPNGTWAISKEPTRVPTAAGKKRGRTYDRERFEYNTDLISHSDGPTFQRLINTVFCKQLGRNIEAYIDEMIVKSKERAAHLTDLKETFETLRSCKMRLNPKKCVFGVTSGKFLGFLIDEQGIETNPDKIQAVMNMSSPKTVKEVQRLTGCLAALGRFLSRAGDKCH